jgi:glutathione S-transferase
VPTLELDDGTILTESKLILDYIDALNPGPKLLPRDGSDGWRTLAEMGQALGVLEGDLDPCAGVAGTATCGGCDRA